VTNETNKPEAGEQQPPNPFNTQDWLVLVGLRQRKEGDPQSTYPNDVIVGMTATPAVFVPTAHGNRPDKTIPAVHFGLWLDRNLPALFKLWEVEYAQYANLARRSTPAGRPPELALVDPTGQRLSTDTTQ
jgi:hypothetical protein